MTRRKGITKRIRFEIFKRDSFTCQYCGMKAPDVVLQVDHVHPVSKGGDNEILNLITSCDACNSGKGAKRLDDKSVIQKQRKQLAALQERRQQLDMMLEWQRGLISIQADSVERLAELWAELAGGWFLNDTGKAQLKKIISRHGFEDTSAAMLKATSDYIEVADGSATRESANIAWDKVAKIASFAKVLRQKPHMSRVMYIRAILRNRFDYINEWEARDLLDEAFQVGVSDDDLTRLSKTSRSWSAWQYDMSVWISEAKTENAK